MSIVKKIKELKVDENVSSIQLSKYKRPNNSIEYFVEFKVSDKKLQEIISGEAYDYFSGKEIINHLDGGVILYQKRIK